ncbi:unnamed protein product [Amoebophrya sp. A120]|nr:unnamed protein product [Amoebophrya sp. A120]|eukprot:GSA120T00022990001.1
MVPKSWGILGAFCSSILGVRAAAFEDAHVDHHVLLPLEAVDNISQFLYGRLALDGSADQDGWRLGEQFFLDDDLYQAQDSTAACTQLKEAVRMKFSEAVRQVVPRSRDAPIEAGTEVPSNDPAALRLLDWVHCLVHVELAAGSPATAENQLGRGTPNGNSNGARSRTSSSHGAAAVNTFSRRGIMHENILHPAHHRNVVLPDSSSSRSVTLAPTPTPSEHRVQPRMFLNSVARNVVRACPSSITVIRAEHQRATRGLERHWIAGGRAAMLFVVTLQVMIFAREVYLVDRATAPETNGNVASSASTSFFVPRNGESANGFRNPYMYFPASRFGTPAARSANVDHEATSVVSVSEPHLYDLLPSAHEVWHRWDHRGTLLDLAPHSQFPRRCTTPSTTYQPRPSAPHNAAARTMAADTASIASTTFRTLLRAASRPQSDSQAEALPATVSSPAKAASLLSPTRSILPLPGKNDRHVIPPSRSSDAQETSNLQAVRSCLRQHVARTGLLDLNLSELIRAKITTANTRERSGSVSPGVLGGKTATPGQHLFSPLEIFCKNPSSRGTGTATEESSVCSRLVHLLEQARMILLFLSRTLVQSGGVSLLVDLVHDAVLRHRKRRAVSTCAALSGKSVERPQRTADSTDKARKNGTSQVSGVDRRCCEQANEEASHASYLVPDEEGGRQQFVADGLWSELIANHHASQSTGRQETAQHGRPARSYDPADRELARMIIDETLSLPSRTKWFGRGIGGETHAPRQRSLTVEELEQRLHDAYDYWTDLYQQEAFGPNDYRVITHYSRMSVVDKLQQILNTVRASTHTYRDVLLMETLSRWRGPRQTANTSGEGVSQPDPPP